MNDIMNDTVKRIKSEPPEMSVEVLNISSEVSGVESELIQSKVEPHLCIGDIEHVEIKSGPSQHFYNETVYDVPQDPLSELNRFACPECDFKTNHPSNLRCHLIRHKCIKPIKCNLCGYAAIFKNHLNQHMKTHLQREKLFHCDQCEYLAATKSNLRKHLKKHGGKESFKCNLCSYSTAYRTHFQAHKRTHNWEMPYGCRECDYKTAHKGALVIHMRTHTGDKPYTSDTCDYAAAREKHLSNHLKIHTEEKPFNNNNKRFVCDVCEFSTPQAHRLAQHKITHSKNLVKQEGCDDLEFSLTVS